MSLRIDAASNDGVDEIRDIRDKSTYAPSLASTRSIIDEVCSRLEPLTPYQDLGRANRKCGLYPSDDRAA